MRWFRGLWRQRQLIVLRIRFPQWDVIQRGEEAWKARRGPVERDIFGPPEKVRQDLSRMNKMFRLGVFKASRKRQN